MMMFSHADDYDGCFLFLSFFFSSIIIFYFFSSFTHYPFPFLFFFCHLTFTLT